MNDENFLESSQVLSLEIPLRKVIKNQEKANKYCRNLDNKLYVHRQNVFGINSKNVYYW